MEDNLKVVKKIGILPYTQNCYFLCSDGNVWLIGIQFKNKSNKGSYEDFMNHLDRFRIELTEENK